MGCKQEDEGMHCISMGGGGKRKTSIGMNGLEIQNFPNILGVDPTIF